MGVIRYSPVLNPQVRLVTPLSLRHKSGLWRVVKASIRQLRPAFAGQEFKPVFAGQELKFKIRKI